MKPKKFDARILQKPLRLHEDHGGKSSDPERLKQAGNVKDFVIKELGTDDLSELGHENISIDEIAETTDKLFRILRKKYGILAPTRFIGPKRSKRPDTLFVVADSIEHAPMWDDLSEQEKSRKSKLLKSVLEKLFVYYKDVYVSGEPFAADLAAARQFVYGKRKGDTENQLYLVDTEPLIYYNRIDIVYTMEIFLENLELDKHDLGNFADLDSLIEEMTAFKKKIEAEIASTNTKVQSPQ